MTGGTTILGNHHAESCNVINLLIESSIVWCLILFACFILTRYEISIITQGSCWQAFYFQGQCVPKHSKHSRRSKFTPALVKSPTWFHPGRGTMSVAQSEVEEVRSILRQLGSGLFYPQKLPCGWATYVITRHSRFMVYMYKSICNSCKWNIVILFVLHVFCRYTVCTV